MDIECAGDDNRRLILPGGVVDGEMTTREYSDIFKLKKDELKQLCRGYGLNSSGNKELLQGRLREFSTNRDDWARLDPEQRRMHRGPKNGKITKAKSMKQSVRRANEVFHSETKVHVPHLPYRLPVQEQPSSQAQANTLYEWAKTISTAHPYVSKEDRIKAGQARLRKQVLAQHYVVSYPNPSPSQGHAMSESLLHQSSSSIGSISNSAHITQPVVHAVQPPSLPPSASANFRPPPLVDSSPAPLSPQPLKPPTRTLQLGDGTHLEFTADEAGPPPSISFADDLPRLNRMWDDRSRGWDNESALVIKGVPIPIVYWREVYGRLKSERSNSGKDWRVGDWKKIKGSWSEWKSIVTRWRQSSEDNFWKEFSDSQGNNLNYKAIIRRLTQIRMAEDTRLAAEARKRYGTDFNSIFWYKKSGVVHVKTKDCDIAKQYRQELTKHSTTPDEGDNMILDSD